MDASSTGIGAILSQQSESKKYLLCVLLLKNVLPAKKNYFIGDRELLVVKLTLEEWHHVLERHVLESARFPGTWNIFSHPAHLILSRPDGLYFSPGSTLYVLIAQPIRIIE